MIGILDLDQHLTATIIPDRNRHVAVAHGEVVVAGSLKPPATKLECVASTEIHDDVNSAHRVAYFAARAASRAMVSILPLLLRRGVRSELLRVRDMLYSLCRFPPGLDGG